MNMKNITISFSALLMAGALGSAIAAESATGVNEHFDLTVKSVQSAQAAAASGDKAGCLENIKAAKQHYKEITGASAGKPLQDALKKMRTGQEACEAGDTAKGAGILSEVAGDLQKIR